MDIENQENKEEQVEVTVGESIKEDKESSEELIINENIIEEEKKIDNTKNKSKNNIFMKLFASIIDQIIVIALALISLVVLDLLLQLLGFYIKEREPMFLIIYVVINIIYSPILESLKIKKTIGKKILFK